MTRGGMRWDPMRELEALRREVERAFEEFAPGRGWLERPFRASGLLGGRPGQLHPLLNLTDDKDHIYVEMLAPGVNPESWRITVLGNTLRIAGEKPAVREDVKDEAYHRRERGAGPFARTVELPAPVDPDKVKADYANGVLLITLPKAEEAKPKQIAVDVS